jgi:hypothetical protein
LAVAQAFAFEPMPDVMQVLKRIFPERNGWFVEEPLGAPSEMNDKARPFFETFRVIVPDIGALDLAVGRLLSAPNDLPIKKVSRYDRDPNAPGLPGFRGIWCRTEDKDIAGVSILTPNQNRFLIWAKYQYYPACNNDSIPSKVRDWYARSAGQYFASLDTGVPDTEPPRAASRTLPDWIDLYPVFPAVHMSDSPRQLREHWSEVRAWGLEGLLAFQPTAAAIDRFITQAPDTLWPNREIRFLQHFLRQCDDLGNDPGSVQALFDGEITASTESTYIFAVDRYGRIRCAPSESLSRQPADTSGAGDYSIRPYGVHAILFPGAPILTGGHLQYSISGDMPSLKVISADADAYFYSEVLGDSGYEDVSHLTDLFVESLGHLFAALKAHDVNLESVTIRKFHP